MRAITRVRIQNFQSHRDSDFELKNGINLITGSSDAGKSAILRAINFVLHNQPRSKSFVRKGAKEAKVTLWFEDGTIVERVKGETSNVVFVTSPEGDTEVYEKFGHELPDKVLEAMGFPPIDERHGAVSYAEQMSPLFIVSLTPTELPRCISDLTGIADYEAAGQALAKNTRVFDRQVKEGMDRVKKIDAQLAPYADIDERIDRHAMASRDLKDLDRLMALIDEGETLLTDHASIMKEGLSVKAKLQHSRSVCALAPEVADNESAMALIKEGLSLLNQLQVIEDSGREASTQKRLYDKVFDKKFVDELNSVENGLQVIKDMSAELSVHRSLVEQLNEASDGFDESQERIKALENEQIGILNQLKEMGAVCTTCGSVLDPTKGHTHE